MTPKEAGGLVKDFMGYGLDRVSADEVDMVDGNECRVLVSKNSGASLVMGCPVSGVL
jgi:hypothetical protein